MSFDFSKIRNVRIRKQQFDAIEKNADTLILSCVEDGRMLSFRRVEDVSEQREYSADDVIHVLTAYARQNKNAFIKLQTYEENMEARLSMALYSVDESGNIIILIK